MPHAHLQRGLERSSHNTSFLQYKSALERDQFDKESTLPEKLTQLRLGKIVRERYSGLSDVDQEAIATMNITQPAKLALTPVRNCSDLSTNLHNHCPVNCIRLDQRTP